MQSCLGYFRHNRGVGIVYRFFEPERMVLRLGTQLVSDLPFASGGQGKHVMIMVSGEFNQ